ncbi:nicotinate-nucleotide--dimethylbenzimidazole phosphoribosyltransferase [Motiliproteus sediminis]|uniref:nicotinate-nucleotide--dimethylbenzimidazole phosphoribosyltransferase n=1 Tax=Motiliproteus sediminis TaxID=1468178 RepID=UPI001AEFCA35|nr:nicotinate-nucleotide--dimethylbenzimidazole phosphoribosyltransferase [Motiliproteus sediminis]
MTTSWYLGATAPRSIEIEQQALTRQDQLTKPQGSLGHLERLAVRLSSLQGSLTPQLERVSLAVFAADHGVTAEGVSAFPQVVTQEMIRNFSRGGAAISVLARRINAQFEIVNVGTVDEMEALDAVLDCRVMAGTANFCQQSAMSSAQVEDALLVGCETVDRAVASGAQLFVAGEMGIGNTTPATALACVFLDLQPVQMAGPGVGLDASGVSRKAEVIARALALHQPTASDPVATLAAVGGLEIAAITGAFVRCAQRGLPMLVDGFITTAAALTAVRINPTVREWMLFGHQSAEPGHRILLEALEAEPVLKLDMRLGEGSGAALAVPILQAACALQNQMATFAEATVSEAG